MQWDKLGIPNVPSIPKVPKNTGDALIKFEGARITNLIFGDKWGIFNMRGVPLLLADNVASVKFENKSQVSIAPVENGSFVAYNKVAEPYKASVMMTKSSGGVVQRGAFLGLLDAFANSADLHMIITPEAVYPSCSIIGYDYVREADNGARMIKANIHFQEVRLVKVEYKKTKSESGWQVDAGKVQAKEAHAENPPKPKESALYRIKQGYEKDGFVGAFKGISR